MKYLPKALYDLSCSQGGVFSRQQALREGLSPAAIKGRVWRGTWSAVYPGVYTNRSGQLSKLARLWAPLLYAGIGAVLSHETAAELHDFGKAEQIIHITIPAKRRVTKLPGIRFHLSARAMAATDPESSPPMTTIVETTLDLVHAAALFDQASSWVVKAFSRGLTEDQLRTAMRERPRLRWRAELTTVIDAAVSGDQSALEFRFTRNVERPHGLPEPQRQVPFTQDGRTGRRDRVYPDYGVVIELDGRQYHPPEVTRKDKARDNAAAGAGLLTLRYDWSDSTTRACKTAAQVCDVLRARGWSGRARRCSPQCPVAAMSERPTA